MSIIDEPRTDSRQLSSDELVELTREIAAEVAAGKHPVHADTDHRWHVRLRRDDQVDVWLISWTTEQGTTLHDHGESSGAFTVVEGDLTETVHGDSGLVDHRRTSGETVAFGPDYIHDVRNLDQPTAVSVHAYSPPLELMHFYTVVDGAPRRVVSSWTDDPEAPQPSEDR